MPHDDESFLDAVLQPADEVARPKRSPWPPGQEPDGEVGEAYKPDVVGPRIRNALRGGHGLAGSPKRYAVLVAVLVGLTSLPTWAVLHTGLQDPLPARAAPAEVFLPIWVPEEPQDSSREPSVPEPKVSERPSSERPSLERSAPERSVPKKGSARRPIPRKVTTERSVPKKGPAPRPVAQKRPAKKPQRIVWHHPQRVNRPCHTWLPWKEPDHGYKPTSGFRRAYSRDLAAAARARVIWLSRMRYLSVRPSLDRSTWTVSPSWISPASSARAS